MLAITRIPTHRNDGSKVNHRERRAILALVRATFGGCSLEGPFQGAWVAEDGQVYQETSYRLEVLIPLERARARHARSSLRSENNLVNAPSTLRSARAARSLTLIDEEARIWQNEASKAVHETS
jgi:hypothetical protein